MPLPKSMAKYYMLEIVTIWSNENTSFGIVPENVVTLELVMVCNDPS